VKSKLFAANGSLQLSKTNHEPIGKAKSALREGLIDAFDDKLFSDNYVWSGAGSVLSAALIAIIVWLIATSYGPDQVAPMLVGMLAPLLFIMGGAVMVRSGIRRGDDGRVEFITGLVLMTLAAALGFALMFAYARGWVGVLPGVAAYILAPLAALGFRWLQAPSRSGRQVMDRIEGFRQYLGVAEEDRLEFMHPPEKTPELFERFLPYAVALDVENTWAKRFAGVLAAAGVGAAAAAAGSSWYSGDSTSDPVSFAEHLSGDLSSTIASSSVPPGSSSGSDGGSSSSDSGGGSSGDGGGGGGGSGW
jgi:uncharacterized membrane protein YgcG